MNKQVAIYDTTLNDKTWRSEFRLSLADKIALAEALDQAGVAYIEAGHVHPGHAEDIVWNRLMEIPWRQARVAVRGDLPSRTSEDTSVLDSMLATGAPVCTLAGSVWPQHQSEDTSPSAQLKRIRTGVSYLKKQRREVVFNALHFFDAYLADRQFAMQAVKAAFKGGADTVVLCDTRGRRLIWEIGQITHLVRRSLGKKYALGVQSANEGFSAENNALAAVEQGARHVQGAINGHGMGYGSVDLCWLIPELQVKRDYACLPANRVESLLDLSSMVSGMVSNVYAG